MCESKIYGRALNMRSIKYHFRFRHRHGPSLSILYRPCSLSTTTCFDKETRSLIRWRYGKKFCAPSKQVPFSNCMNRLKFSTKYILHWPNWNLLLPTSIDLDSCWIKTTFHFWFEFFFLNLDQMVFFSPKKDSWFKRNLDHINK